MEIRKSRLACMTDSVPYLYHNNVYERLGCPTVEEYRKILIEFSPFDLLLLKNSSLQPLDSFGQPYRYGAGDVFWNSFVLFKK